MVDNWNIQKLMEPFFPGKFIFAQICEKKPQNDPQIVFFLDFLKNLVMLVFLGNNLKSKLILLLTFHHHISWKSTSQVIGQNAASQSNCRILENPISSEKSEWWVYKSRENEADFLPADTHKSFLLYPKVLKTTSL